MKKKWWQDKVAYQIYPKSFCDSNADGIGDLPGIINQLDYLKDLGIDIIWLSPVYTSPLADQGYDIADYYNIDPRFGTMDDMDRLIAEANKREMYILMDLVVNHCSDEHEWFQKALADPDGPYGRYFYMEEMKDGKVPTNWRSYFGGSAWEPIPGTTKFYLHMFHKKQPDLNWENPEVRDEIYKNINWWLQKGLSGFRIDAIINIKKPLPFQDYPADREDGTCAPQEMLHHAKGIGTFLTEMRDRTFAKYDAFTVGEVFDADAEEVAAFIGENGYFSSMFDFNETIFGQSELGWYDAKDIMPEDYKRCCFESQKQTEHIGFLSNIIENHDEPRGVSHYIPAGELNDTSKKLLAAVNMMLRGLPFIYQGQELGMENTVFKSIAHVDDISTLDQYQTALNAGLSETDALKAVSKFSRDNARTPMQWSAKENAGFTDGIPWLKPNPNYTVINAEDQLQDPNSILAFYKELIALRKHPEYKEVVVYGKLLPYLQEQHQLMAYYRRDANKTLLLAANFQTSSQTMKLPSMPEKVLLNNYADVDINGLHVTLFSYQVVIFEL